MKNISRQLFRIKDLDSILSERDDPKTRLKRVLGPIDLTILGIGAIVGAGIFATIGSATAGDSARPGAGPALIVSFAITAVACGFAALCYAEFASMVPISGSAYTYSYASFGELIAWIIGWDLIIEYSIGNVAVAISWSGYFRVLLEGFGINLPQWSTIDYRTALRGFNDAQALLQGGTPLEQLTPGIQHAYLAIQNAPHIFNIPVVFNAPAAAIVIILTVVLVIGIKESARFNELMVLIKLLVLGFFVFVGAYYVKPANWVPFAPNGFTGIKTAAAIVFFSYIGFDAVSTVAEETRNPKRDLPIGIIASLVICTVIYMVVAAVFTGIIPFNKLITASASEKAEPLTLAMRYANLNVAAGIVAFGSIIAHTAVLLVFQLGQARLFFSMSRDGLLPQVFSKVHPKFRTPHVNTIIIGLVVALFSALANLDEVVDLTNIGTLFAFILVCFGVIILRIKEPHRHRAFKVPLNPLIPLLGVCSCIFLMTSLTSLTWLRFVVWLIIGLAIYFAYSFTHSLLHKKHHPQRQQQG